MVGRCRMVKRQETSDETYERSPLMRAGPGSISESSTNRDTTCLFVETPGGTSCLLYFLSPVFPVSCILSPACTGFLLLCLSPTPSELCNFVLIFLYPSNPDSSISSYLLHLLSPAPPMFGTFCLLHSLSLAPPVSFTPHSCYSCLLQPCSLNLLSP